MQPNPNPYPNPNPNPNPYSNPKLNTNPNPTLPLTPTNSGATLILPGAWVGLLISGEGRRVGGGAGDNVSAVIVTGSLCPCVFFVITDTVYLQVQFVKKKGNGQHIIVKLGRPLEDT